MSDRLETLIESLLIESGDDYTREGLKDTPRRVAAAYREMWAGYGQDPAAILRTFDSEGHHDLISVTQIPFYSTCEHHLLPFFGVAHIGYIPEDKIIGISKIARVVEIFARRLQVQERLTAQVADTLFEEPLGPQGVIVVLQAEHLCMAMRGILKPGTITTTSAIRGIFVDDVDLRAEFLSLIQKR